MKTVLDRLLEYCDKHVITSIIILLLVLLLGIGIGCLLCDAVEKQTRRWDSWMWAHQMEFVPRLKWNNNQCLGESTDKYANRFCEEPSTLYKKYWVWKHY